MSRRIVGSKGQAAAKINPAKLERRAVDIRQDAWQKLTSWLVVTYSDVVAYAKVMATRMHHSWPRACSSQWPLTPSTATVTNEADDRTRPSFVSRVYNFVLSQVKPLPTG